MILQAGKRMLGEKYDDLNKERFTLISTSR